VLRRHAEIDRQHDDAALRERLIERRVVEPVARRPGAAMHVDHGRERAAGIAWPDRPVEAGQQRHAVRPLIFEVSHLDLEPFLDRHFRHLHPPVFPPQHARRPPRFQGPPALLRRLGAQPKRAKNVQFNPLQTIVPTIDLCCSWHATPRTVPRRSRRRTAPITAPGRVTGSPRTAASGTLWCGLSLSTGCRSPRPAGCRDDSTLRPKRVRCCGREGGCTTSTAAHYATATAP